MKKELDELRFEHLSLKSEHDDLLVLLSDQEEKIHDLKSKCGIEVSSVVEVLEDIINFIIRKAMSTTKITQKRMLIELLILIFIVFREIKLC